MNRKDFASGFIAESIGTGGSVLTFVTGYGQTMPAVPFHLTATPPGQLTTLGNSEKLLVTAKLTDETFTITRAQGDTIAKDIRAGWVVSNAVYVADIIPPVTSVNGKTGAVVINKTDIGLSNVPNLDTTAAVANQHTHANKAILDSITAPYTTAEQTKLAGISSGATSNSSDAFLLSRTNHTGVQPISTVTGLQAALDSKEAVITAGTTGQYWRGDKTWQTLNKATIGLSNVDNTADIAKPISTATQTALNAKQDTLMNTINIKSINGTSLLGSGDVVIATGGGTWGSISGTLSDQVDLQAALDDKFNIAGGSITGPVDIASTLSLSGANLDMVLNDIVSVNNISGSGQIEMSRAKIDYLESMSGGGFINASSPISMDSNNIVDLLDPVNPQDAATMAYVDTADSLKANLASPSLTGTPTAPTAIAGTNTTQIATTAFATALAANYVLKAGDTSTGAQTVPQLILNQTSTGINSSSTAGITRISGGTTDNGAVVILGGTTNGAVPNTGILRTGTTGVAEWSTGFFVPGATGTIELGGSGRYWLNTFTRSLYVNSGAIFSGPVTGTVNLSGNLGIAATSSTATHSVTLGSTATGIAAYNTVGQTTNYERVRQYWNANTYTIASEWGGTGAARSIKFTNSIGMNMDFNPSSAGGAVNIYFTGSLADSTALKINPTSTASSATAGGFKALALSPIINQSGTAGYTALLINPTGTATGSGAKNLIDAQVGGVSLLRVPSTGDIVMPGTGTGIISDSSAGVTRMFGGNTITNGAGIVMGGSTNGAIPDQGELRVGSNGMARWDATGLTLSALAGLQNATHTLTLTSSATGIALYNTADQTTNYERVRQYWAASIYNIFSEIGGSGAARPIRISAIPGSGYLELAPSSSSGFVRSTLTSSLADSQVHQIAGVMSASSGVQYGLGIVSTKTQSGTAGYTDLFINSTETSTGSGSRLLIQAQVGGSDRFRVSNVGAVFAGGQVQGTSFAPQSTSVPGTGMYRPATNVLGFATNTTLRVSIDANGVLLPFQAPTASAPTYVLGGIYFDTTLNKLRVGGASGWETVTST